MLVGHNFSGEAINMPQQHGQQASYNDNKIASQLSLCWVILCTPTEEEGPSEISTDFVKVGEREQNESSVAGGTICLELWIPNSGGREGENASTFCCVGLAHSMGKKMAGIEIEEVAVAGGGGGGSADIIGDREENISGEGGRTRL